MKNEVIWKVGGGVKKNYGLVVMFNLKVKFVELFYFVVVEE